MAEPAQLTIRPDFPRPTADEIAPFKDGLGEIGGAISPGDVTINAGDLLVDEIDVTVVVPRTNVRTVGAELNAVAAKEAKMDVLVNGGAKYPAWLDDILGSDRVRYIDYVD